MTENRQYSRISFRAEAHISLPTGEFPVTLLDISLKGALVRLEAPVYIALGSHCTLQVALDDIGDTIRMAVTVVHHQGGRYGLACREIDLDSVTHLRRLVALNLGDEALLERELSVLSQL